MASDDSTGGLPRGQTRVPIDAEVQLEFENFSGFIREVSANLSLGGMFVKTRYLKPVGTIVRFEFRLSDQYRLIRGSGEVVWTRWRDQPPAMPAGMGIQFLDLDAESRSLVTAIVEQHERAGGSPFDLESQAEIEARSHAPSDEASFADALPAASGAGVSSAEVSQWLRAEFPGNAAGDLAPASWSEEAPATQAEVFVPPTAEETSGPQATSWGAPEALEPQLEVNFAEIPELPELPELPDVAEEIPAASPDEANAWRPAPPEGSGQSRPLDWGAAEAMAALGIATSAPLPPAAHEISEPRASLRGASVPREPAEIPAPQAARMPPPPRFGGGQAARVDDGSRRVLWAVVAVALAVIAVGGWWIFRGRQSAPRRPAEAGAPAAVVPSAPAPQTQATPQPPAPSAPSPPAPEPVAAAPTPTASAPPASLSPATAPATPAPPPVAPAPPPVAVAPPVAQAPHFSSVLSITWQARGGETEVVIATNGSVRAEDVESTRLEKPEPRELLKLKGVRQAFNPTKLETKTPELRQIRVGFHEEGAQGQLHIVLDLASPDVRVLSTRADGVVVRVRLGRS